MYMHKFVHVHAHFNFIILGNSLAFNIIYSYVGFNACKNNFFTLGISVTHHKTSPPLPTTTMIKTHWFFRYTKSHPPKSILVQFWQGKYHIPYRLWWMQFAIMICHPLVNTCSKLATYRIVLWIKKSGTPGLNLLSRSQFSSNFDGLSGEIHL